MEFIEAKGVKDQALQKALIFLLACSRGSQPTPEQFKRMADLCGIALPMKYRLPRWMFDAIDAQSYWDRTCHEDRPDNKTAWLRVRRLSHSLIFQCGHPRGGCPNHCDPLVKIFDLACERLDAEPEQPSTPVAALSELVDKITPENLHPEQGKKQ